MNIDDKLLIKTEQAADEIWWSLTDLINAEKFGQALTPKYVNQ